MRFRKLKIFVGIALVVFILVIGNIYAFGLLKKVPKPLIPTFPLLFISINHQQSSSHLNRAVLPRNHSKQRHNQLLHHRIQSYTTFLQGHHRIILLFSFFLSFFPCALPFLLSPLFLWPLLFLSLSFLP